MGGCRKPDYLWGVKAMENDSILAWHFVGATLRDGKPVPRDGEWLIHEGPIEMCRSGLHASLHPFDALQYAPGATLCRVECCDRGIQHRPDKLVCRERRILSRIDATDLLRMFAREQALSVLHLWKNPPVAVVEYLKTGDMTLREAAREAAWGAAREAARKDFSRKVLKAFQLTD